MQHVRLTSKLHGAVLQPPDLNVLSVHVVGLNVGPGGGSGGHATKDREPKDNKEKVPKMGRGSF